MQTEALYGVQDLKLEREIIADNNLRKKNLTLYLENLIFIYFYPLKKLK